MNQPDLFEHQISAEDKEALRKHLYAFGWQTRREICQALGWCERKVRDVAEAMGSDVVRGQAGFKLTCMIHRESQDVPRAMQAFDAAISQGKKMIRYGLAGRKKLHGIIG